MKHGYQGSRGSRILGNYMVLSKHTCKNETYWEQDA